MAKKRLSGCGCIGVGLVVVVFAAPVLSVLRDSAVPLLISVLVIAGTLFGYRVFESRRAVESLGQFSAEVGGSATFIVLDTETSGLSPEEGARVVQIALIAFDVNLKEVGRYSTVVNPHGSVGMSDLHGVTSIRAFFAPDFKAISGHLQAVLDRKVMIAHNASFDEKFLRMEFSKTQFSMPSIRVVDTLALAQKHIRGAFNYKLMTLVSDLGIDLSFGPAGQAHDALYDAWCCAEVFKAICIEAKLDPAAFTRRS